MYNIRNILEVLDQFAGQSVGQVPGDQVRGTEKARMGSRDHPFKGRLVGAAEDRDQSILRELEAELNKPVRKELGREYEDFKRGQVNKPDVVKLDVPLLIRIMEYAREDAKTDMDLHNVAENLINLSTQGRTLSMSDYEEIVGTLKEYGGVGGMGARPQAPQGTTGTTDDPKQQQAQQDLKNIAKNVQGIKTQIGQQGGTGLNVSKAISTLAKTNVTPNVDLSNPEEKQIAQFAPALSNILKNPQTAGQLKQLVTKAGTMDQAMDKKLAKQPIGTNLPAGQQKPGTAGQQTQLGQQK